MPPSLAASRATRTRPARAPGHRSAAASYRRQRHSPTVNRSLSADCQPHRATHSGDKGLGPVCRIDPSDATAVADQDRAAGLDRDAPRQAKQILRHDRWRSVGGIKAKQLLVPWFVAGDDQVAAGLDRDAGKGAAPVVADAGADASVDAKSSRPTPPCCSAGPAARRPTPGSAAPRSCRRPATRSSRDAWDAPPSDEARIVRTLTPQTLDRKERISERRKAGQDVRRPVTGSSSRSQGHSPSTTVHRLETAPPCRAGTANPHRTKEPAWANPPPSRWRTMSATASTCAPRWP
jgi:hypothetical protein